MDVLARHAEPVGLDGSVKAIQNKPYVTVTFDDGFVSYAENALPEMIKRHIPSVIFVPCGWIGRQADWVINDSARGQLETVLTEAQLKELSRNRLVSIGSHCGSHKDLCLLEDKDAFDEISKSKEQLIEITGEEIGMLSFPFGSFRDSHVVMAKRTGYTRVFSILPIPIQKEDEFIVGRTPVEPNDTLLEFRMKLAGAYRWLPAAYALKGKIRSLLR
jgi:peptidoglycan/xylan/chitin deacetylase (PgdA/CDA1 family)